MFPRSGTIPRYRILLIDSNPVLAVVVAGREGPAALRRVFRPPAGFFATIFFCPMVVLLLAQMMILFPLSGFALIAFVTSFMIVLAFLTPNPILAGRTGDCWRFVTAAVVWRESTGDCLVGGCKKRSEGPAKGRGVVLGENTGESLRAGCFNLVGVCIFFRRVENFFVVLMDEEDAAAVAAIIALIFTCSASSLSVLRNTRIFPPHFSSSSSAIAVAAAAVCDLVLTVDDAVVDEARVSTGWVVCESNSTYAPECSPDRRRRRSPSVASSRSKISPSDNSRSGRRASADL